MSDSTTRNEHNPVASKSKNVNFDPKTNKRVSSLELIQPSADTQPNMMRVNPFCDDEGQNEQEKQENLNMFKKKVQQQIINSMSPSKNVVNPHNQKYDKMTVNKPKNNHYMSREEGMTPVFYQPQNSKIPEDEQSEDYEYGEGSENISEDSSLQEIALTDNHKINQISFDHSARKGFNRFSAANLNLTRESSSKKEIIEFDARVDGSDNKINSKGRESDIKDSYQMSGESIVRNLENETIYEEEERNSTIIFDPKHNLVTDNFYIKQKDLKDTQDLMNYKDNFEENPTEEFEWKNSQQNIFPPNLSGTEEIEEIIHEEQSESEKRSQKLQASPKAPRMPSYKENILMEKILESDDNHLLDVGNSNTLSDKEQFMDNPREEDTIINLTTVQNEPHLHPTGGKENRGTNNFDRVMLLSNSKDSQDRYDEILFAKEGEGDYHEDEGSFDPNFRNREQDHEYIYHDTLDNPNDIFALDQRESIQYDTPDIKGKHSPEMKRPFVSPPKISVVSMEETLINHKKNRIEQLIDRMHMLIGKQTELTHM